MPTLEAYSIFLVLLCFARLWMTYKPALDTRTPEGSRSCSVCYCIDFSDLIRLVEHFRSDPWWPASTIFKSLPGGLIAGRGARPYPWFVVGTKWRVPILTNSWQCQMSRHGTVRSCWSRCPMGVVKICVVRPGGLSRRKTCSSYSLNQHMSQVRRMNTACGKNKAFIVIERLGVCCSCAFQDQQKCQRRKPNPVAKSHTLSAQYFLSISLFQAPIAISSCIMLVEVNFSQYCG